MPDPLLFVQPPPPPARDPHARVRRGGDRVGARAGEAPRQNRFHLLPIQHGSPHRSSRRAKIPPTNSATPISPMTTPTGSMIIVTPRASPTTISTKPRTTVA